MSHTAAPALSTQQKAENVLDDDAWTVEQEARLVYVQRQLRAAQAAWSEEQELWIDEVRFFLWGVGLRRRRGGSCGLGMGVLGGLGYARGPSWRCVERAGCGIGV